MCHICEAAMASVLDRGDGATALAWDRADAAIKAWSAACAGDVDFTDEISQISAWCKHMDATSAQSGVVLEVIRI